MSQNSTRGGRTQNLSGHLHRNLSLYALAAGAAGVSALALATPAAAQIVYTPAHETLSGDGKLSLDLNHDGIADVTLHEFRCFQDYPLFPGNSLQAVPQPGGGAIEGGIGFNGASALSVGEKIGPTGRFTEKAAMMANYTSYGIYFYGAWTYQRNTYLGIRFLIEGETHYGWARLNVRYNFYGKDIIALVTGYAYQEQGNRLILAGDEGKGIQGAASEGRVTAPAKRNGDATLGALALGAYGIGLRRGAPVVQQCPF